MRIYRKCRRQKAIYWQRDGIDEYGRPVFKVPVIISCRWDTQNYQNSVDTDKDSLSVNAAVIPDRVLVIGSYLMLGDTLDGMTNVPPDNPNAFMVKTQQIVPELSFPANFSFEPNYSNDRIIIQVTL
jgi:hypothetical protein